jgi:acetylglutamate kinase
MNNAGAVVGAMGKREVEGLRTSGAITGGMLPKLSACLEALQRGVPKAYILPGNSEGILGRLASGKLEEGTYLYGDA